MADNGGAPRSSNAELFTKKASFIQHSLPGLQAGSYELSVQQAFADAKGNKINPKELATLKRRFGVEGPRYTLSAGAIHSVYPPPTAAGGFSNSLAHVVLEQEKLPWIRTPLAPHTQALKAEPEESLQYQASYGGQIHNITYDNDRASWLAVLLITPTDLAGGEPEKQIVQGKASDLAPATLKLRNPAGGSVTGGLLPEGYSIFSHALEPGAAPEDGLLDAGAGHTPDEPCRYIDLPAAFFDKVAPSLSDLEMMAHVRAVEMDTKPIQDGQSVTQTTRYSIVVGNRLPQTMPATRVPPDPQQAPAVGKNVAVLVSLENMQHALRGHSKDNYYAQSVAANAKGFVRLIVLYQWSFISWQDSTFEFEHILKGLNGRDASAFNTAAKLPNPLLRRPNPPSYQNPSQAQVSVQEMIALGYTPMNHLTRVPDVSHGTAEKIQTVSWYRGPFVPFATLPKIAFVSDAGNSASDQTPLIYSADQLLRFDPKLGLYDTTYAAAWQLGRLISLQDKSFSVALYRWKQTLAQKYRMRLENHVLQQNFSDLMGFYRGALSAVRTTRPDKAIYNGVVSFLARPGKK